MAQPETATERDARLKLERQCAEAFNRLNACPLLRGEDFTLLFFDYADRGNVAFTTSLTLPELIQAWSVLLASWSDPHGPRVAFADETRPRHSLGLLTDCGLTVAPPPGVGFALLIGKGEATSYIATGDREGVIEMLQVELLPNWRRALG